MAQHARPTGPTAQNNAAAFSPEMVTGTPLARSPIQASWMPPRLGWSSAQTTHVAAPFMPDMTDVKRPEQPRLFSTRNAIGLQVAQTTHVAAPFEPGMTTVTDRPSRPQSTRPATPISERDWQAPPPEVLVFSIEMVVGAAPASPRPLRPTPISERDWQVYPSDSPAPFSPDMVAGWQPVQKRETFPAKPGWSVSQLTHVDAPITTDMLAGWRADRNREALPLRTGLLAQVADVQPFSVEMAVGHHPDRGRLFLAPRLGLPLQVAWHVDAPITADMLAGLAGVRGHDIIRLDHRSASTIDIPVFSIEMIVGQHPDSPRLFLPLRRGVQIDQALQLAAAITLDMLRGSGPERPRLPIIRRETLAPPPDVLVFSVEMAIGSHPDLPRVFPPHRLGLSDPGSAIDIAARFGQEMIAGWLPARSRDWLPVRTGWKDSQTSHVTAPFSTEMTAGWQPVQPPKIFVPKRVGWRDDVRAIHQAAAFSIEMVRGSLPPRPRLWLPLRRGVQIEYLHSLTLPVLMQVLASYAPTLSLSARYAISLAALGSYVPVVGTGVHSDWVEIDFIQIDPEWTK